MVWRSDGETISDREARNVMILHAEDAVTVTWSRYSTGEHGPDLHLHREHTDAFYVLSGALRFALGPQGERSVRAPAGTFVSAPPGVAHSFMNDEADDATWLNIHTPDAGFAAFLRAARDGRAVPFDSFDVPGEAGGDRGRPAAGAVVVAPGTDEDVSYEGPDLRPGAAHTPRYGLSFSSNRQARWDRTSRSAGVVVERRAPQPPADLADDQERDAVAAIAEDREALGYRGGDPLGLDVEPRRDGGGLDDEVGGEGLGHDVGTIRM
ncbi:MAG: cupin [Conexibacter sp.]|nr:cupin [Conexibacter sp.]